jgi:hypothetical protein
MIGVITLVVILTYVLCSVIPIVMVMKEDRENEFLIVSLFYQLVLIIVFLVIIDYCFNS